MKRWTMVVSVIAGLAALFVTVSAVAQAIRQGSWEPVVSVGWIPAILVAMWPGTYRRCVARRRRQPLS